MFRYSFLLHSTELAMTSKLVFILLLAVLGAQAARIEPKPDPKDLRVVALDIIEIVKMVVNKINQGIAEAKPTIVDMESLLSPELREIVHRLLQKTENKYFDITDRLTVVETAMTNSIDTINKEAKTCVDDVDADMDPFLAIAETEIAKQYYILIAKYQDVLTDIKTQTNQTFGDYNDATDKAIAGSTACVKKGSTTVKPCMDENSDAWNAATTKFATNGLLIFNQLLGFAPEFIQDGLAAIQPIAQKLKADADPSWVKFGNCVSKLS